MIQSHCEAHVHYQRAARVSGLASVRTLRLAIISEHATVRRGLRAVARVASGLEVVGEAADQRDVAALVATSRPDVVLLDVVAPDAASQAAIAAVKRARPQTRVVVLATFPAEEFVFGGSPAGADAYLLKDVGVADLLRAIRQVSQRYSSGSTSI